MSALARAWRRLDRDEGGQITFLAVVGAAAFASLLLLVIQTGYGTGEKIRLQNAADAAAYSGAAWSARGLNVISTLNVTQTQLYAVSLILRTGPRATLAGLTVGASKVSKVCAAVAVLNPTAGALCAKKLAQEVWELGKMLPILKGLALADYGVWLAISAVDLLTQGVRYLAPAAGSLATVSMGTANGAHVAMLWPSPVQPLPLKDGRFRDICGPTRYGHPGAEALMREDRWMGYGWDRSYPDQGGPYHHYALPLVRIWQWTTSLIWYLGGMRESFDFLMMTQWAHDCAVERRKIKPPLLAGKADDIGDQLDHLAVVGQNRKGILGSALLRSPWDFRDLAGVGGLRPRMAYAQARVFNATSFDTFTPDWQVRLVPASKASRFLDQVLGGGSDGLDLGAHAMQH